MQSTAIGERQNQDIALYLPGIDPLLPSCLTGRCLVFETLAIKTENAGLALLTIGQNHVLVALEHKNHLHTIGQLS